MKTKLFLFGALAAMMLAGCDDPKVDTPEPELYTITVTATTGGSAEATFADVVVEQATAGTEITLSATENTGYYFVKWNLTGATPASATSKTTTFTMPEGNVEAEAEFAEVPPTEYDITVTEPENGTIEVTADGEAVEKAIEGTEITLTATPNEDYVFTEWTIDGVTLDDPTDNPVTFEMPDDEVTVEARFKLDPQFFDDGVLINGVKWATRNVDMPGVFSAAPENPGMLYQWGRATGWSSTDPLKGYDENGEIVDAVWDNTNYAGSGWMVENNPCPAGWQVPSLADLNTLADATKVTSEYMETPVAGYKFTDNETQNSIFLPFANWRRNTGVLVETTTASATYWSSTSSAATNASAIQITTTANQVTTFTRSFCIPVRCVEGDGHMPSVEYDITITPAENGTITATYEKAVSGTSVTITATPSSGYRFVKWTVTGATPANETTARTTITMPESDVTVEAEFELIPQYDITLTQATGGTITASAEKAPSRRVITITATPDEGYELVKWTLTGATPANETALSTTFTMPEGNVTVTAEFVTIPEYNITVTQSAGGTIEASAEKAFRGSSVTITATPNSGYEFIRWALTGASPVDLYAETTTFKMLEENVTVTAEFREEVDVTNGVLINGVKWAAFNVDKPGSFAETPESYGMYYQWNRKTGWTINPTVGYDENGAIDGATWDSTNAAGDTWDAANDPCPEGWRVPAKEDFDKLVDAANVTQAWLTAPVTGRRFTDNTTGVSIFLPAAGMSANGSTLTGAGQGYYRASTLYSGSMVYNLQIQSARSSVSMLTKNSGISVRCVKK